MNSQYEVSLLQSKMEQVGKILAGELFKEVESECHRYSEEGKPTLVACKLRIETVSGKKLHMEGTLLKNKEESLTLIVRY